MKYNHINKKIMSPSNDDLGKHDLCWWTTSSYLLNAREINVYYIAGFLHGSVITIPSGFIIYGKSLLYLGVYHANTNEEKAKIAYARRESNLVLINYREMVYHNKFSALKQLQCTYSFPILLFNVHGSLYSLNA